MRQLAHERTGFALQIASIVLPALILGSVWVPVVAHYYVASTVISTDHIDKLRSFPSDELLIELGTAKHALIPPLGSLINDPVAEANAILITNGKTVHDAQTNFHFDKVKLGSLDYAMLSEPRTLLKAYERSGDEKYFSAARSFIFDWMDYELNAWVPEGLLWNDHALAARTITLSEFWRIFRKHSEFDYQKAQRFLELVVSSGKRLADPDQYAYASNHGTMQNIGLMHLSLAFPNLDGLADLAQVAIERQVEQSEYMISPDGFVLEHSAGYHRLGMELLAIALRYQTLLGRPLPDLLTAKYLQTLHVYAQLRSSDGKLPPIGDTSYELVGASPLTTDIVDSGYASELRRDRPWPSPQPASLYPDAGYAIWWSDAGTQSGPAQTTIVWSHFERHGHKHADELSANIRTGDTRWWTSVGYWPLGNGLRESAQSWTGSNAPHLLGESYHSRRNTTLRGYASSAKIRAIDLERKGPGDFIVRRAIIYMVPDTWLTIDEMQDSRRQPSLITWTTGPRNRISPATSPGSFRIAKADSVSAMQTLFVGDPMPAISLTRGQKQPFLGWVEDRYRPAMTDAVAIETASTKSWVANLSIVDDKGQANVPFTLVPESWNGSEQWQFSIRAGPSSMTVRRNGATITTSSGEIDSNNRVTLSAPPDSGWREKSSTRFNVATARYGPAFRDLIDYRSQISRWIIILILAQALGFVLARAILPQHSNGFSLITIAGWCSVAAGIHFYYLPA